MVGKVSGSVKGEKKKDRYQIPTWSVTEENMETENLGGWDNFKDEKR